MVQKTTSIQKHLRAQAKALATLDILGERDTHLLIIGDQTYILGGLRNIHTWVAQQTLSRLIIEEWVQQDPRMTDWGKEHLLTETGRKKILERVSLRLGLFGLTQPELDEMPPPVKKRVNAS